MDDNDQLFSKVITEGYLPKNNLLTRLFFIWGMTVALTFSVLVWAVMAWLIIWLVTSIGNML